MIGSAYLESRILSADPIELVNILYEHAILYTAQAREALAKRDIQGRSAKIGRVISILGELDSSLNHSAGGDISANLARLYQYMRERLLAANLKQQDEPLDEVERLLTTLAEAWHGVAKARRSTASNPAPERPADLAASFAPDRPVWGKSAWQMTPAGPGQAWTA
ncbi:MAG TPA: flagellar export chaperone FliS [Bryobacteraceae bacterium]|nr:flagellar export chaperone FliS [Bryobacteraceae bacterium]